MCLNHPALVQALARDRAAELRHSACVSAPVHRTEPRSRFTDMARHRAGWLLVDLGLRLASPSRLVSDPLVRTATRGPSGGSR